jgi:hypothetical protein
MPTVSMDLLYRSYMAFSQQRRERHSLSREALGRRLTDLGCRHAKPYDAVVGEQIVNVTKDFGTIRTAEVIRKDRAQGYRLGELDVARAAFEEKTGLRIEWGVSDSYVEEPEETVVEAAPSAQVKPAVDLKPMPAAGPSNSDAPAGPASARDASNVVMEVFYKASARFGDDTAQANKWMQTEQAAIGMRRPDQVCSDPNGVALCLAALAKAAV